MVWLFCSLCRLQKLALIEETVMNETARASPKKNGNSARRRSLQDTAYKRIGTFVAWQTGQMDWGHC